MATHKPWPGLLLVLAILSFLSSTPARADYADGWRAFQRGEYTRAVDLWRYSAWIEDDLRSQKQLGDLYREGKFVQRDQIEAYVWYYLALANPTTLGQTSEADQDMSELLRDVVVQLDRLYFFFTTKQREQAQDRVVYILASRGAEGHFRLGELYDEDDRHYRCRAPRSPVKYPNYPDAESSDPVFARIASLWIYCEFDPVNPVFNAIPKSNMDALIHYTIADRLGQPAARRSLRGYQGYIATKFKTPTYTATGGRSNQLNDDVVPLNLRKNFALDIITRAEALADVWQPPYEVYPGGHSDESRGPFERQDALKRVATDLEPRFVQEALKFLTFYSGEVDNDRGPKTKVAIARYQASIGAPTTGWLGAEDTVRLIKDVADRGYAPVQAALGTMYFHGIGEPQNYARARYWFEKAADQLDPYALFNLAILYRDGLGVDVDASQAATYFMMAKRVLQSRGADKSEQLHAVEHELRALGWSGD